jgi:hypothetical protein
MIRCNSEADSIVWTKEENFMAKRFFAMPVFRSGLANVPYRSFLSQKSSPPVGRDGSVSPIRPQAAFALSGGGYFGRKIYAPRA